MATHRETFALETNGAGQAVDITAKVTRIIQESGLADGIACIFAPGSTCAIVTNEFERGLVEADVPALLERIAPANANYAHNLSGGDENGHSHLRSALLGQSVTVPFGGGRPLLGTWQQVILLELDVRRRSRQILVQLVGD